MRTSFLVSVKCPECGSPANYPEGAYTFQCAYCGSVLRIRQDGRTLKYIIRRRFEEQEIMRIARRSLAKESGELQRNAMIEDMRTIYKPFWYFKGMIFYNYAGKNINETLAKTWYHSFQANEDFLRSFNSLSIRTEVLTLEAYDSVDFEGEGSLLPLTVDDEEARRIAETAAKNNVEFLIEEAAFRRLNLIGEHFFIIYYPVIDILFRIGGSCRALIIDGVNECLLAEADRRIDPPPADRDDGPVYHAGLLTHRCKNCGHDLKIGDFDLIFYCDVCYRLWLLKDNDYHPMDLKILKSEGGGHTVYVPFWRFEATITSPSTGVRLRTVGDLSGFMRMGRFYLRHEDPRNPIRLYIPALMARNARALMKLSDRINIRQKQLPHLEEPCFPSERLLNASLPESEAEEMLQVAVFSLIGRRDQHALAFYHDFQVQVDRKELVWYPFEEKGNYLVDHFHDFNFPKRSLDIEIGFRPVKDTRREPVTHP
jgi:ribosomal protein S27E